MSGDREHPVWIYPKSNPKWRDKIVKEFRLHPIIAQILVSRGFKTFEEIHDFLYAKLPDLHDPFLLNHMKLAVDRLCKARVQKEKIMIYGDNDVDGMTGTALLTEFLKFAGFEVHYYTANPSTQKKATLLEALDTALSTETKIVITVDVGITAGKEIKEFTDKGIDVIVTDHHEPNDTLPICTAILNPKLSTNTYPERILTGVGVAFKLVHGLTNQLISDGELSSKKVDLKRYLDLVALGTISDMGALVGENRILVRYGLEQMKKGKRVGLAQLLSVTEVDPDTLTTFIVASRISPPLNSLGRIANANDGVKLLLLRNAASAETLAEELGLNNIERQKIEKQMSEDVEALFRNDPSVLSHKSIVITSEKWHPGVIPIISTRLSKQYHRPTCVIAINEKFGKGSMRSIPEFPLLPALKKCADLLENFGGHDFAAGMFIREEKIPEFRKRFMEIAENTLKEQDIQNKVEIDAKVDFSDLTYDCLESIRLLEPFGNDNPAPILYSETTQAWPPKVVGKSPERAHLKMYLVQEGKGQEERILEGIALGQAKEAPRLRKKDLHLEVAFTPQFDIKKFFLQLLIKAFKIIPR